MRLGPQACLQATSPRWPILSSLRHERPATCVPRSLRRGLPATATRMQTRSSHSLERTVTCQPHSSKAVLRASLKATPPPGMGVCQGAGHGLRGTAPAHACIDPRRLPARMHPARHRCHPCPHLSLLPHSCLSLVPACPAHHRSSQLLDSDAYLQGINTLVHNPPATLLTIRQSGQAAGGGASSGGGLDHGPAIPPELQRWVFDWSELTVLGLLGRGSYGRVRCGWLQCKCKVLPCFICMVLLRTGTR